LHVVAEAALAEVTLEEASGPLTWAAVLVGLTSAGAWAECTSVPVLAALTSAEAWAECIPVSALAALTLAAAWAERMSVPVSVVLTHAAAWVSDTLRAGTSLVVSSATAPDVFATLACLTTVGRSIVFTRGGYPSVRRAHERFWRACDDAIKAAGNPPRAPRKSSMTLSMPISAPKAARRH